MVVPVLGTMSDWFDSEPAGVGLSRLKSFVHAGSPYWRTLLAFCYFGVRVSHYSSVRYYRGTVDHNQ